MTRASTKFDKLGSGNTNAAAIARARGAFFKARTIYARRKALLRLEELGAGPPAKVKA